MKTISIVLTRYTDIMARVIYWLSGRGYTHSSLALDAPDDEMYSFNYRGFCIETPLKHKRRGVVKSMCIHLNVSDLVYERLQEKIESFKENRINFHYDSSGILLCLLRIPYNPFRRKEKYFCSQFVAEMLDDSGAIKLKNKPSMYLPNDFKNELLRCANLQNIQYNVI